jgi:hypothetical protein
VRALADLTLRSIWERRDEYIERCWTERCRMTKTIAMMPMTAAAGPTIRYMGIGADYRRSVHV